VLFALAWQVSDWLVLDAGGDFGLFPAERNSSVFAGLQLLLPSSGAQARQPG